MNHDSKNSQRQPFSQSTILVVALFLLVLNDHVLKGADFFPSIVTGKLSDFAGLFVASALMTMIFKPISRRGLILCLSAPALFLLGLQFSNAFSQNWTKMVGLLAIPWNNTPDPTDIIALSSLPFIYIWLRKPARHQAQRAKVLLLTLSTGALMATGAPPCENSSYSEDERPLDARPTYGDGLDGNEMLTLASSRENFSLGVESSVVGEMCPLNGIRQTLDISVNVASSATTARHFDTHVDEELDVDADADGCNLEDERSEVHIEASATLVVGPCEIMDSEMSIRQQSPVSASFELGFSVSFGSNVCLAEYIGWESDSYFFGSVYIKFNQGETQEARLNLNQEGEDRCNLNWAG